jgi:hypothetical protein
MKYKKKIVGPCVDFVVIPRPEGEDFVVKCVALTDFSEYEDIAKHPTPPFNIGKGGKREYNLEEPSYKALKDKYENDRITWIILKSISDNPDIEWERVDITNTATYPEYEKELMEAGLNTVEIGRIQRMVLQVNSLDEAHIQEARDLFLLTKAAE